MNDDVFWDIIARLDGEADSDDAVLRPAIDALVAMSVDEIKAFDDILSAKLFALDTRELCRGLYRGVLDPDDGDAYVSADMFLYERCAIVANGKTCYEDALTNPDGVPQGLAFESLLYLAGMAYERKVGDDYDHTRTVSSASFGNTEGWRPTAATKPGSFTGDHVPKGNRRPT